MERNPHDANGCMCYTPEYKMQIVLQGLRYGIAVNDLRQQGGISVSTYYRWRRRCLQGALDAFHGRVSLGRPVKRTLEPRCADDPLKKVLRSLKRGALHVKKDSQPITELEPTRWMLGVLQNGYSASDAKNELGQVLGLDSLLRHVVTGNPTQRNRALAILARHRGITYSAIAAFLHISERTVYRYWKQFKEDGTEAFFARRTTKNLKADDDKNVAAVFSLLHSPPSDVGINRTSWRMEDLKSCLALRGVSLSKHNIRKIMKRAGYTWRKAKVVLTSNDPDYKEKLARIQSVLSSLGKDERFFSVDEFGPFAIKRKGGRKLVAPSEYPSVPRFQKSKGSLIITAALELSANQITHFYSQKKDTDEMIRLLDVLLSEYRGCARIYLSWDAASWHVSKKLNARVKEVNEQPYRLENGTPEIVLMPLPASAQFLNVIESVFSGMARAVVHNSDYKSVTQAKSAIDRYFEERNEYFQHYPRVAGRKIWGTELVPSQFDEAHNCKDQRFR